LPVATYSTLVDAPPRRVFAFHEEPSALARLTPPWERVDVVTPPASLAVGTRVVLRTRVGPLWLRWVAEHIAYERDRAFADRQVEGPFASWEHHHLFDDLSEPGRPRTRLTDRVAYELPLGPLGALFGGVFVRRKLDRLFAFRHEVTRRACEGPEGGA
jgi:ligand-binding SRPBCC domain-containing protein